MRQPGSLIQANIEMVNSWRNGLCHRVLSYRSVLGDPFRGKCSPAIHLYKGISFSRNPSGISIPPFALRVPVLPAYRPHFPASFLVFPEPHKLGNQFTADNVQPGQFGFADADGLRHMIPHPARELISLLFQLIQQLFHLSGLLCQLRAGHGSGIGVSIDQAQLLKLRDASSRSTRQEISSHFSGSSAASNSIAARRR